MSSMQGMWQIVNTIQLFYLLQLLNFEYPTNLLFFVKPFDTVCANLPLLSSLTFDLFSWAGIDFDMLDHPPLNDKFEEYNHESTSVLIEAADTICILCLAVLLFILLLLLKMLGKACDCAS